MPKNEIFDLLDQMFLQAKMHYGSALKTKWFYDGDGCPGCKSEVGVIKFKKKKALSINVFFYREHSVLIAYMLCSKCANHIFKEKDTNPLGNLLIHDVIEKNLKQAFVQKLGH